MTPTDTTDVAEIAEGLSQGERHTLRGLANGEEVCAGSTVELYALGCCEPLTERRYVYRITLLGRAVAAYLARIEDLTWDRTGFGRYEAHAPTDETLVARVERELPAQVHRRSDWRWLVYWRHNRIAGGVERDVPRAKAQAAAAVAQHLGDPRFAEYSRQTWDE
jgi:hypothetical protein